MSIQLSDILDVENLKLMVKEGYIRRKDSGDGRVLYDYSELAQFGRVWNNETRLCRGLVTDDKDNLLARPFPKFWNLDEHASPELPRIPNEPFEVTDKLDGSLIIAYAYNGELAVNTRGSFESDQAIAAGEWLRKWPQPPIDPDETWLFEWIAPDNRIVVNYGDRRECVLLDIIDNRTGLSVKFTNHNFTTPEIIDAADYTNLPDRDDAEGYVIRFESGFRVKVKHPRYVQLHKILGGLTEHRIWEVLSTEGSLAEILAIVPDETYEWIVETADLLHVRYFEIKMNALKEFGRISFSIGTSDRKSFALEAVKSEYRSILFSMLDVKSYDKHIWKMLEPKGEQ